MPTVEKGQLRRNMPKISDNPFDDPNKLSTIIIKDVRYNHKGELWCRYKFLYNSGEGIVEFDAPIVDILARYPILANSSNPTAPAQSDVENKASPETKPTLAKRIITALTELEP